MYKTGQFAKMINKNIKTLQKWDRDGDLKPEVRTETNRRMYSHKQYIEYMKTNFDIIVK